MKSLSLYEDKQSFLNGLTPGCKAFYIIAALVIPAMLGNKLISIGFIVLSILLLTQSKVIRRTLPILAVSGFVLITVIIIQGLFRAGNETVVLDLGPVAFYKEGLIFAADIAIKAAGIELGFVDRFSGTLIVTGTISETEAAIRAVLDYVRDKMGFSVCEITRT